MDTTLLATGFPPQQENSDGAPPAVVEGTDNAAGAAGTNVDPSTQNNQLLQQQLFQQQMNMLPASLMGSSQLQQQLSALSGLTNNNGAAAAPMTNNLLNMGAMQGYLMPHQQQLFQGGFPQGLNAQLLQLGNAGVTPQQQDFSDRDQATNQVLGNNNQQLAQATMPQLQQGLNQLQQLQLMMTQQLIAAQSGGMMPANLSALFPLGNPMGNMGATLGQPSLAGVWPGFGGAPQMQQGLQLQNQGGAANAMNLLLSTLSGGATQAAAPAVAPIAAEAKPESEWAEPFVGKGKKEPPFPLKLHQILGNPEFQECISWNAHGRSWRILKPPVFEQIVIPLYFRHAKYASFMRQVNGWGFKRIVSGNDHNSYYHEFFIRENPQLCLKMKRIKKKSESSKAKKGDGHGDTDDDESKGGTEDDTSLAKQQQQAQPVNAPSMAAQIPTPQMSFQQQGIFGAQQSPGLLAALQNMQQGAGASAFQSPAFPGLNPGNLAGLASTVPMLGLSNTDAQMMLAGLLSGSAGAGGVPNMATSGLNGLMGVGQAPTGGVAALGGVQQDSQPAGQPASGLAPGCLGDLAGIDSAQLAKRQEAVQQQQNQQPAGNPTDSLSGTPNLGQFGAQVAGQNASQHAAELQAATQPPTTGNVGGDGDDDEESGGSGSDDGSSDSERN